MSEAARKSLAPRSPKFPTIYVVSTIEITRTNPSRYIFKNFNITSQSKTFMFGEDY